MPEWLIQGIDRGTLVTVCLFGMWGVIKIAEFFGPELRSFFANHKLLVAALIEDKDDKKKLLEEIQSHQKDGFTEVNVKLDAILTGHKREQV